MEKTTKCDGDGEGMQERNVREGIVGNLTCLKIDRSMY